MKKLSHTALLVAIGIVIIIVLYMVKDATTFKVEERPLQTDPCERLETQSIKDDCYKAKGEQEADASICKKVKDRRKQVICERRVVDKIREFEEAKAEFEATHQLLPID